MKKFKAILLRCLLALLFLYLVLLIPDGESKVPVTLANKASFAWNNDSLWLQLENDFMVAKTMKPGVLDSSIAYLKTKAIQQFDLIKNQEVCVEDTILSNIQHTFFSLATLVAVKPTELKWYTSYYNDLRNYVKKQSQSWNMGQTVARNRLYIVLYGMRAAVEEVILQTDSSFLPEAMLVKEEPSATPAAYIFGIPVHSGDMLVSRGGAEVSALISRGNDYPGNFSHIAFLYVDDKTNKPFLLEAHIEKGVAIATVDQYEKDKKLRFMVMRPRANLPAMVSNPMLPHQAAKKMYEESFTRHIPYDFKMNYKDSSAMFCSEVASYAYKKNGLELWPALSTISSNGVVTWLHEFGVENFVTQMPSDLEYDPQLSVVAEWRDPETLYKDHIDNAVMDAMLEQANNGKKIDYNNWQLPIVRLVKAWCIIKNKFGKAGMIPEGMNATTALKNQWFVAWNQNITKKVKAMSDGFIKEHQYRPPYWQLVKFAQASM